MSLFTHLHGRLTGKMSQAYRSNNRYSGKHFMISSSVQIVKLRSDWTVMILQRGQIAWLILDNDISFCLNVSTKILSSYLPQQICYVINPRDVKVTLTCVRQLLRVSRYPTSVSFQVQVQKAPGEDKFIRHCVRGETFISNGHLLTSTKEDPIRSCFLFFSCTPLKDRQ